MPRRLAQHVHHQVSRLMAGQYILKEPLWYQSVLKYPPIPLPAKEPVARTDFDTKPAGLVINTPLPRQPSRSAPRPLPIRYVEDDLRRQFFRDHPFEAFRPITLVENREIEQEHPIRGEKWTRLRQRGRNPKPEDAIQYAVNLHTAHNVALSEAYSRAVAQFRALRAEHHIATTFAILEAEAFGAEFGASEIEHGFKKEKRSLLTWERREETDQGAIAARKRWKTIIERKNGSTEFTKGQAYVKLWKQGVRPNYFLTPPVPKPRAPTTTTETASDTADYMSIRRN